MNCCEIRERREGEREREREGGRERDSSEREKQGSKKTEREEIQKLNSLKNHFPLTERRKESRCSKAIEKFIFLIFEAVKTAENIPVNLGCFLAPPKGTKLVISLI